ATRAMSACNAWCQAFVGTHSSRHKEKGGRYAIERETQGASFKEPSATIEVPTEVPAPAELPAPADIYIASPADTATRAMSACNGWCQEFVGDHSSRHKEKGGRYALEAETQGSSFNTAPAPAPVEVPLEITTRAMSACNSWCQEFVGNHSSRHKEKGG
ncbi:hypothetical protein V502_03920, partial [Pseudogymnoascus sp. VKM F-4520 (FW-2644)]